MDRTRRLPDAELTVMQAVWDCGAPATRAEIEARLPPERHMAATTLLTLLSRLAERADKAGRGALYTALVSRKEYLAGQSRSFLDKLCGGSLSVFAAALCDSGLSREELDELRALLERNEL